MGIFSRKKSEQPDPPAAPHGLVANRPVQEALGAWAAAKNVQTMSGVLRQCATGELLLDGTESVIADPGHPFQKGDTLAIGSQVDNAGKRLLVAFTDNERLGEYRRRGGSTKPPVSFGQPASATLAMAAKEYDGIAIDPGSPETVCIAYTDEILRSLTDDASLNEPLKTAIEAGAPVAELIALGAEAPVIFVGVSVTRDANGEAVGLTAPAITGPDGGRWTPAFTTPAEVWAWAPDLDARPSNLESIAHYAREDGHTGIALNPAGTPGALPLDALAARFSA